MERSPQASKPKSTQTPAVPSDFVELENFIFKPMGVEALVHYPDPTGNQSRQSAAHTVVFYQSLLIDIPDPQRRLYYYLRHLFQPKPIES